MSSLVTSSNIGFFLPYYSMLPSLCYHFFLERLSIPPWTPSIEPSHFLFAPSFLLLPVDLLPAYFCSMAMCLHLSFAILLVPSLFSFRTSISIFLLSLLFLFLSSYPFPTDSSFHVSPFLWLSYRCVSFTHMCRIKRARLTKASVLLHVYRSSKANDFTWTNPGSLEQFLSIPHFFRVVSRSRAHCSVVFVRIQQFDDFLPYNRLYGSWLATILLLWWMSIL